ncbi:hypothetical protein C8F04DRAFT_332784 [Mycena alexandri]|uniref:Uncharacterized protein n=1 Tax=Mycena alexandri TaxID=1745969 RepID=A0AAD6X8P3_9AGAR|nr:hypothetical protein C8F04DRAFT_332784 [Mycena alexandri]
MARTTSVIIETTGGSPVFHIPFPLSAMVHIGDNANDVQLIFRNSGGNPTFHVGGADVGVAAGDAWDYGTVVRAVMSERRRVAAGGVAEDVRVKVEEVTPRMSVKAKGKGKEREIAEVTDEQGTEARILPDDLSSQQDSPSHPMSSISNPLSSFPNRPLTREERSALARGSLSRQNFAGIYEDGRQDFAFTINPSLPVNRDLTAPEEIEWIQLWEALLRLDRVYCGPLRGMFTVALGVLVYS